MFRRYTVIGAVSALLCVAIGAFGAHGLDGKITERMMANYHTGVQYHMFHSLGILIIGLVGAFADRLDTRAAAHVRRAGGFLLTGIILFSGSLYVMALTGKTWLGAITPFGGLAFLAGWAFLAAAGLRIGKKK